MKTYTPVYFIKKLLIFLLILLPVCMFIMQLTVVRAEEAGADELNKARDQLKTGEELVERHFIKVPDDEWPSQVIFDTIHVCYNGTIRWITMGNPNLLNQAPPYPVARAMTIHCFCVMDKLRTKYKYTPYVEMINKDDPMNPRMLPNKFMEHAIKCIKEHNTLSGLVVLDQDSINMFGEKIKKQKDNETKNDTKIEVKPPNDNSGKSDSLPEQPKELPTEDTPLLNF
tara:strand:- start:78 stop:758 length:681 start_codon:yes stop_codon:yes gene_type:complete